ncbi:MAG: adenylosuccinate lyase [Candidatus Marisimplicoccus sp.]|jgi:adenylosuccinate lyase|nr:adenylosuccinate lyase [Cryomorphaceae bacterium]MBT7739134.1 adenylosuccinate lyase [Cryomorphaceae bacterium]RZP01042.1 MAG: adenylosuccinate lyase [Flavobacteriales bacterium]|tara:strand:+ start:4000 stop:5343 length:1344 start_codon:yes stop_codon:yes gene_type:complete
MNKFNLNSISPIDGRYYNKTEVLSEYFSEKALIFYRLKVEIEYFISLCNLGIPQLKNFDHSKFDELRKIYLNFSNEDAIEVKRIEKITNHDVKAVEYFIKDKFETLNISEFKEFIHFGLTSQDINNSAIPLSIKDFIDNVYMPKIQEVLSAIDNKCEELKDVTIIARTHGQAASPTKLGKEFKVFWTRINEQIKSLKNIPNSAKFSGAVGNFNAHKVAYPEIDWKKFGKNFIENELGLNYSFPTTQIEHYDSFAALCDNCRRINNILLDMCVDIWTYISHDYFKQKIIKDEVGSSAMPHKVNPIDFENSEGNLGLANSTFDFFSNKLTKSRLQRDLTDSTVLRNIGVPFGHTLISFESLLKGLKKIYVNEVKINKDVEDNWIVVSEAIQTILRREGYSNPYEIMKELTRSNERINKNSLHEFIDKLDIDDNIKNELKQISPYNYTGI